MTPLLDIRDLHASYGGKEILRGVSLCAFPQQIVGLSGENGSGKSTLLKVIAGVIRPRQGNVYLRGRDIGTTPIKARLRDGVGYLMQGGRVFQSLTVQQNLDLAAGAAHSHKRQPSLGEIFPTLRARSHSRAGLLSGGERQMLAIELAFASSPEVLLLDEPTAALNEDAARHLLLHLREYARRTGATIILVEHVFPVAHAVTTRVRLANGVINTNGS